MSVCLSVCMLAIGMKLVGIFPGRFWEFWLYLQVKLENGNNLTNLIVLSQSVGSSECKSGFED